MIDLAAFDDEDAASALSLASRPPTTTDDALIVDVLIEIADRLDEGPAIGAEHDDAVGGVDERHAGGEQGRKQALRGLRGEEFDYFCSTEPEPEMDVESFGDPTYSTVPDPVTVASSSSLAFTTTSPEPVTPTFARLVCSSAASTEPLPDIATVKRSDLPARSISPEPVTVSDSAPPSSLLAFTIPEPSTCSPRRSVTVTSKTGILPVKLVLLASESRSVPSLTSDSSRGSRLSSAVTFRPASPVRSIESVAGTERRMEVKFSTCLTSVLILPEPYVIAPPLFTIMHWSAQSRASRSPAALARVVGHEAAANMKQTRLVIFAPLKFLRIIGFAFFCLELVRSRLFTSSGSASS